MSHTVRNYDLDIYLSCDGDKILLYRKNFENSDEVTRFKDKNTGEYYYVTKMKLSENDLYFDKYNQWANMKYETALDAIVSCAYTIYYHTYDYAVRILRGAKIRMFFNTSFLCEYKETVPKLVELFRDENAEIISDYVCNTIVHYYAEPKNKPAVGNVQELESKPTADDVYPRRMQDVLYDMVIPDKQKFEDNINEWFGKETGIW